MARMLGDLQTPYDEPGMSAPDGQGEGVTERGGRPMPAAPAGPGLVATPFAEAITPAPDPGTRETPNDLSGLPLRADGHGFDGGAPGADGGIDLPDLDQDNRGRTLD